MLLQDQHIVFVSVGELDWSPETFLFPKDRDARPHSHMGEEEVLADEHFFGFYEVGCVEVVIDSSAVEAGAGHVFAPPADDAVVEGEVFGFGVEFLDMSLEDGHSPQLGD